MARSVRILQRFQIFKDKKAFGGPVMDRMEARLLILDDQNHSAPGLSAEYAIHDRLNNTMSIPEYQFRSKAPLLLAA